VRVQVKGAKGKKCLSYVQLFEGVGRVRGQQLTPEYYEPETPVKIADDIRTRTSG